MMNKRRICGVLIVLLLLALPLMARQTARTTSTIEPNYILALGTANRFLAAWQRRDQDAGFALLSSRLRGKESESDLRMYLSGLSNPHHAVFEIDNGWKLTEGRYAFDVRLYEVVTNSRAILTRPKVVRIVLQNTSEGEWRVDSLP